MRPIVLKLFLVVTLSVVLVDRQAEPVSSAEQPLDGPSWTEMQATDAAEPAGVELVLR